MATSDKDFRVKNGLVVQGATATVNGHNVLTDASSLNDFADVDTSSVSDGAPLIFNQTSLKWIPGSGIVNITVGDTKPSNPSAKDLFFNTTNGGLYIYYSDADTSQWVQIGTSGPSGIVTVSSPLVNSGTATAAALGLATTAVTPGSYTSSNITVDAFGRITAAANGSGGGGGADPATPTTLGTVYGATEDTTNGLNVSLGFNSAASTTGVAIGAGAESGAGNTAVGYYAYAPNDWSAIAIGNSSAATGSPSIAVGHGSTVDGNSCIGVGAYINAPMWEQVAGYRQIVIGNNSRFSPSDDNIFIGDAIDGGSDMIRESVVIGNRPHGGQLPNIPERSVFIGYDSGATDVGGSQDVAVGWKARTRCSYLYSTSTLEEGQVAVGKKAASGGDGATSLGNYSTAYGHQSTAIGNYATVGGAYRDIYGDYFSNSFNNSTAVGANAVAASNYSIAVGAYSGAYADYSTAVGNGSMSYGTNSTVVGYGASTWDSNTIVLGDSNITSLQCNVQTISALSDARDKTNIQPLNVGLDFINALNPVTFDWDRRDGSMEGESDFGFIAQELAAAEDSIDMADTLSLTNRNDPEKLLASYGKLVPILVQAIKDLSNEVNELKEKLK